MLRAPTYEQVAATLTRVLGRTIDLERSWPTGWARRGRAAGRGTLTAPFGVGPWSRSGRP